MIVVDADAALRYLRSVSERQAPYALALAMTRAAKEAQAHVVASLPKHFKIRRPWTAKGIRIKMTSKAAVKAGNATVSVYTMDPYMRQQAEGADRVSGGGGASEKANLGTTTKLRAVPGRWLRRSDIRRSMWPDRLLRNRKLWRIAKLPSGVLAVIRARPKKGQAKTGPAWILVPSVRLKPRWPFAAEVQTAVNQGWPRLVSESMAKALASAKV